MANIPTPERGTVAERIRIVRNHLAPAELAVATVLVDSYPMAGLVPIVQLATTAKVSAPTVLRFVGKLGFAGYGAFHKALRAEVQARIFSPVDTYPGVTSSNGAETLPMRAQGAFFDCIRSTFSHLDFGELAAAVAVLSAIERPVLVLGGRFSSVLARQLVGYLTMLRPRVTRVESHSGGRIAGMVDVGPGSVVVVYDYRRYQQTSIEWGAEAAARGAHLVVITDQYLSPLAPHANCLLTTGTAAMEPFDSMTGGFALTELLISEVARTLGAPARQRLAGFETLQMEEEQKRGRPADRRA